MERAIRGLTPPSFIKSYRWKRVTFVVTNYKNNTCSSYVKHCPAAEVHRVSMLLHSLELFLSNFRRALDRMDTLHAPVWWPPTSLVVLHAINMSLARRSSAKTIDCDIDRLPNQMLRSNVGWSNDITDGLLHARTHPKPHQLRHHDHRRTAPARHRPPMQRSSVGGGDCSWAASRGNLARLYFSIVAAHTAAPIPGCCYTPPYATMSRDCSAYCNRDHRMWLHVQTPHFARPSSRRVGCYIAATRCWLSIDHYNFTFLSDLSSSQSPSVYAPKVIIGPAHARSSTGFGRRPFPTAKATTSAALSDSKLPAAGHAPRTSRPSAGHDGAMIRCLAWLMASEHRPSWAESEVLGSCGGGSRRPAARRGAAPIPRCTLTDPTRTR